MIQELIYLHTLKSEGEIVLSEELKWRLKRCTDI